jgi:pimeloyl-ACP methyl ester carboxylesterase
MEPQIEYYESTWQRLVRKYFIPTSQSQLMNSLRNLLSHHCKSKIEYKTAVVSNGFAINYIEINNPKSVRRSPGTNTDKSKTLVLMHGYAAGLGFFYENYDKFGDQFDRVLALDWPGMGGSSRGPVRDAKFLSENYAPPKRTITLDLLSCLPDFAKSLLPIDVQLSLTVPPKYIANSNNESVPRPLGRSNYQRSVEFFIDSLESFRQQELGQDSTFVLAGHSLGGLLSANYAVKYPDAIDGLILISPVGLNNQPLADTHVPWYEGRKMFAVIRKIFELNITPQDIARSLGPRGPEMVNSMLDRRFGARWSPEVRSLLGDYLYHITVAPACGEYALHSMLQYVTYRPGSDSDSSGRTISAPETPATKIGVFSREPFFSSMHRLKDFNKPVLVLYGDDDWLRYPTAAEDIKRWKEMYNADVSLDIIPKAGHHLYLDNAPHYHNVISEWLQKRDLCLKDV